MRIVFDHGMGAAVPGGRTPAGRTREAVMIIHTGQGVQNRRLEEGMPLEPRQTDTPIESEDGMRIPGTNLVMRSSEDAKFRDAEVRGHERAHLMALGGNAASGINLITRQGPDGQSFAVGGRIKVDLSPVPGDSEATIRKAKSIIHAATAPGNPSAADLRVAAQAYRMAASASKETRSKALYA